MVMVKEKGGVMPPVVMYWNCGLQSGEPKRALTVIVGFKVDIGLSKQCHIFFRVA